MFGNSVLTFTVDTGRALRPILRVHLHRPITAVVFVAVRGAASTRISSGALFVSGTS